MKKQLTDSKYLTSTMNTPGWIMLKTFCLKHLFKMFQAFVLYKSNVCLKQILGIYLELFTIIVSQNTFFSQITQL